MTARSGPDLPRVLLLGPPELQALARVEFRLERRFQLLALLALADGQWVPRDRIAVLFWPDHGAPEARRNLRKVVFRARELDGAQGLQANEHALRWDVDSDLRALRTAADPVAVAALWRGPLLDGLDDPADAGWSDWLQAERARWLQVWRHAVLPGLQATKAPAGRSACAEALLRADALDEEAVAALIDVQLAAGHAAEARRSYDSYRARLAEQLGVEPARALRERFAAAEPPRPVQPPPDDFIGRRHELAELAASLARPECRLLTLVGPGGVGKSRLARQALAAAAPHFAGGAAWVELQDLGDLAAVTARIAQRLELPINDIGGDTAGQLARGIAAAGRRLLLVLDNAEHLAELPAWLDRLLDAAPPLTVLATSRVRGRGAREWPLPLAGLAVPDEDSRDAEAAASFDAVRLFELRARQAQRGFRLDAHAAAVAAICEAVGGLPLAIELAASWVRLLPPQEIAGDLQRSIDLLERDTDPAAVARPEHRSLRAVIERSWQLLAPAERRALAALSVFHGGFTRAAAQAVAQVPLALLASLADKSLLAADDSGRFALHPTVALFAAGQRGDDEALRQRHAALFARYLADLTPHRHGDPRRLVDAAGAEFANCRVAWRHAVERHEAALVAEMAPAWAAFFDHRGRLVEGIAELQPALEFAQAPARGADGPRVLARLRQGLSTLLFRKGDLPEARAVAEAALAPAGQCGDSEALCECLGTIGLCLWHAGQSADALPPLQRALALAEAQGLRHAQATALAQLAIAERALGDYDAAMQKQHAALAIQREIGDQPGIGARLNNIGNLHRSRYEWGPARRHFEAGLEHCRAWGLAQLALTLRLNLGFALIELGEMEAARGHMLAVIDGLRESGQARLELAVELGLARIHIAQREFGAVPPRLRRVLQLARLKAFDNFPVVAASVHAEWLAAQGERLRAAGIWLMASTHPGSDRMDRDGALELMGRLALSDVERAQLRPPTLEQVLHEIERDA